MSLKPRFLAPVLAISIATGFAGCGKTRTGTMPPKEEAVSLMDRGENAKAARVLEGALADSPDDDESKLLLASAYMGLAGIDIYRIFDAFQDLIFKRSLKDQILGPKRDDSKPALGDGEIPGKAETKTKAEAAMASLDRSLSSLQLALVYLDRFPQVDAEKWPLLEAALARLESMEDPSSDTFTYRVLIRLIYAKSYLVERVFRNERVWTREWACAFDANDFDEDLEFFVRHILAVDEELGEGAERGSKSLAKARKNFRIVADAANSADGFTTWDDGLTFSELENSLKGMFHCSE